MKRLHFSLAGSAFVLCCAVSSTFAQTSTTPATAADNTTSMTTGAMPMGNDVYSDHKKQIEADYKSAKAQCDSLADNAKDVCVAQAKGDEKKALAKLDADHRPSARATEKMRIADAEADYDLARARCGSKAGNDKDVCMKEAKSQEVSAKADAKANRATADARADARDDKREANYKVALQKCDGLAGGAKDQCVANAKATYQQ